MTNFAIGAIAGFLICVWAVGTTPGAAFSALWVKLEQVQAMSAAANQAYEAMNPPARIAPAPDETAYR